MFDLLSCALFLLSVFSSTRPQGLTVTMCLRLPIRRFIRRIGVFACFIRVVFRREWFAFFVSQATSRGDMADPQAR